MHLDSPYIKLAPWYAVQCHFTEYIHKNSDTESEMIVVSLKYALLFLGLYFVTHCMLNLCSSQEHRSCFDCQHLQLANFFH